MQFNSYEYLLLLPITVIVYYFLIRKNQQIGKLILIVSSLFFYLFLYIDNLKSCIALVLSVLINYLFSLYLSKNKNKQVFIASIIFNIILLIYYKYTGFFITNINNIFNVNIKLLEILLPVGISFFTFQQIAYLVSIYKDEIKLTFIDYVLYILYFPKLLMGPLMEPKDFFDQINNRDNCLINYDNIVKGIVTFSLGLIKKVLIADTFSKAVNWGFNNFEVVAPIEWILIMLFYTFEIYFDFSGYSDMAVGSSLMFNIKLPINFDSPYKALSIRDFWKRWHISLTKFFTKYLYIPLGGNRKGNIRTYLNTFIVFFISGLWHGSNWTYILWGTIFGLLMIIEKAFFKNDNKRFKPFRWIITFIIINILWLLFRSDSIIQWIEILKKIFTIDSFNCSNQFLEFFALREFVFMTNVLSIDNFVNSYTWMFIFIVITFIVCLVPINNYRNINKVNSIKVILSALIFIWCFVSLSQDSTFVYFGF